MTITVGEATQAGPPIARDVGVETTINTPVLINLLGSQTDGQLGDCGRPDPLDCPDNGGN